MTKKEKVSNSIRLKPVRVEGWESILHAEVEKHHAFEWGKKDCALFCADIVQAFTGIDYAEPFRGKYDTKIGAAKAIKKYGHGSLELWCDSNFPEIHTGKAQRGDVILHDTPEGLALGVCIGHKFAAQSQSDGTLYIDMSNAVKAWKV